MKLLIVKLSAFGDIIHALPALHDILERPEVDEVHWLVDQRYGFVTEVLPARVIVHQVALKGNHPISSAWHAVRKLRPIGFDAVIDLQGLIKSAALARACGSPVFAFDPQFLREKVSMIFTKNITFHALDRHVVQQYRRIASAPFTTSLNSAADTIAYTPPQINIEKSHCKPNKELLKQLKLEHNSYVILHAAGGWQTKQLPEKSWISIARNLTDNQITPVFSWGNQVEERQANKLAAESGGYALPERLNMSALVALIQSARAVVGADTGLLHLSAALNRPTITFWGPSASWNSAPFTAEPIESDNMVEKEIEATISTKGVKHWHIESSPGCGPCFKRTCKEFTCMDAIKPESITRIIHEL